METSTKVTMRKTRSTVSGRWLTLRRQEKRKKMLGMKKSLLREQAHTLVTLPAACEVASLRRRVVIPPCQRARSPTQTAISMWDSGNQARNMDKGNTAMQRTAQNLQDIGCRARS